MILKVSLQSLLERDKASALSGRSFQTRAPPKEKALSSHFCNLEEGTFSLRVYFADCMPSLGQE